MPNMIDVIFPGIGKAIFPRSHKTLHSFSYSQSMDLVHNIFCVREAFLECKKSIALILGYDFIYFTGFVTSSLPRAFLDVL